MPDLESEKSAGERNITKKVKLRSQRFDEIAKKEKKISIELFKRYFSYLSPSCILQIFEWDKKLKRKQNTSKYNRK